MQLFNKPEKISFTDEQVPSPCHCSWSHPPFVQGRWILGPSTALQSNTAILRMVSPVSTILRRWYIINILLNMLQNNRYLWI